MTNLFETTGMDDPLGLWAPAVSTAESAPGTVSFSTSPSSFGAGGDQAPPEAAEPLFRANLPADDASAARALTDSEGYILRLNAALEDVPARLDGLVVRTQQRQQQAKASGVSFNTLSFEQYESGPEADLLALLGEAPLSSPYFPRSSAESGGTEGGREVSFGLTETTSAAWQQAKAGLNALIEQVNREALHFAWVETNIADVLIARTTVGWTGDAQTAFTLGVDDRQVILHHRTVRIATQTRNMRLRLFVTIATGAAKVSTLMATPAGAALALPAVYQYVMQIVVQLKQLEPKALQG